MLEFFTPTPDNIIVWIAGFLKCKFEDIIMITIRQGGVKDIEVIVDFQLRMAKETEDLALDGDILGRAVKAVFEDKSRGTYYIAQENGRAVGMLLTIPEWSDWRNGTVLWIHSLYVIPEARKKGVFTKLYEYLRQRVENSDEFMGLRLYVDKKNAGAQKVYESLGMNRDHYLMYEWFK